MFPGGMNPKNMGRMMKQMGIKNDELDAERVEITLSGGKKVIFENPQVQLMVVQGQKTYTIMGDTVEETSIPEDDIKMVAESAEVSEEEAKKALEENDGDMAQAIMKLKGEEE
ncbi:MAG: nascent polypeptide-associated complex protein [Candidatus Diapherotrites archaeon]|jgi:nascent polypeptide-associated complex subunit alpha|uniref:Nascent polypeptide-associated complex protein n=1 Tax=Candidatus Iainarchaeum sp. TaxID=3101447 RepID=A0A8T5GES4_9ARCH|nr:nascent polypeptide-associated complex protein [Candidatus Diapherotrites archaeon]MBT7241492.1 nascent polypeptide-associated complex protein [Candidatus Diapherotrites archaeon]